MSPRLRSHCSVAPPAYYAVTYALAWPVTIVTASYVLMIIVAALIMRWAHNGFLLSKSWRLFGGGVIAFVAAVSALSGIINTGIHRIQVRRCNARSCPSSSCHAMLTTSHRFGARVCVWRPFPCGRRSPQVGRASWRCWL